MLKSRLTWVPCEIVFNKKKQGERIRSKDCKIQDKPKYLQRYYRTQNYFIKQNNRFSLGNKLLWLGNYIKIKN